MSDSTPSDQAKAEEEALEALLTAYRSYKARTGKSRDEIAMEIGVTGGALGQWLSGHRPIPVEKVIPLASLLGVPDPRRLSVRYRALADQITHFIREKPANYILLSPEETALVENYRQNDTNSKVVVEAAAAAGAKHKKAVGDG